MTQQNKIYVFEQFGDAPKLMGILNVDKVRGKETFSFEYNKNWLKTNSYPLLDPDIQHYNGIQYLQDENKPNFGIFLDSSPDRWGRELMQRREAIYARNENRSAKKLFESDFLLGISDELRTGALRFKLVIDGPFLNNGKDFTAPPIAKLRELESISLKTENDIITEEIKWIRMLANPGSSLGGARPKANVVDEKGDLYIAKFPSKEDSDDKGLWEYVTYQLAIDAGINMSPSGIEKLSSYHTFLTKRFDRVENRKRIHVASAMTMLGYYDGYSENVSYLEIADFLTRHSVNPHKDLQELFRRIAFNICVSNCDDHLRNHSFIFDKKGISLSPAYDINPDEIGHGLSLNISLHDNSLDLEILMDTHEYYALQKDEALQIIEQVKGAVSGFDVVAKKTGLSKTEIDKKAVAFKQAMR